ncbi:hypothetical protein [Prevotella sp. MA2016]|uniref:hypothetical protein n=1 Tax=Prevotella sp. MA2016 TaxID=1408310 RepID=UPI0018CC5A24|nr:hypothetical protein [Prevotella sp. MA2016]
MKYVVSAINKLTGEREAISAPRSLEEVKKQLETFKKDTRYKRQQAWRSPRIEKFIQS